MYTMCKKYGFLFEYLFQHLFASKEDRAETVQMGRFVGAFTGSHSLLFQNFIPDN